MIPFGWFRCHIYRAIVRVFGFFSVSALRGSTPSGMYDAASNIASSTVPYRRVGFRGFRSIQRSSSLTQFAYSQSQELILRSPAAKVVKFLCLCSSGMFPKGSAYVGSVDFGGRKTPATRSD